MYKIKSLGIIALCAVSFTFMSFGSSSDDMYNVTYASNIENSNPERIEQAVFPTVALTAIARLQAAEVVSKISNAFAVTIRIDTRNIRIVDARRITAGGYANNVEKNSRDYAKVIEDLKDQEMRKLG